MRTIRLASALLLPLLAFGANWAGAALQFQDKWGTQGPASGQFEEPNAVAVDGTGHVYVVDTGNNRVQKFRGDGTFETAWGSAGSGDGQFLSPKGIAVDASGNIYVADSNNNRIQKFTSSGAYLLQWGTLGSGDGQFFQPRAVAVGPDGSIYVTEDAFSSKRVQKFSSTGVFLLKWGSIGTGDGQFSGPRGIAVDDAGFVYVSDTLNDRVQKFTSTGVFVTKWGTFGSGNGQLELPIGLACRGASVFVADADNSRIQEFDGTGNYVSQFGNLCRLSDGTGCSDPDGGGPLELGDGEFYLPRAVAVDRYGYLFVVDAGNYRIAKFGDPLVIGVPDGGAGALLLRAAPNPFRASARISFQVPETASGEPSFALVRVFDIAGREVRRLWEGGLPSGPASLAWDGRAESGNTVQEGLYVAVVEIDGARAAAVKLLRIP